MRTHTTAVPPARARVLTTIALFALICGPAHPQAQLGRVLTTIAGLGSLPSNGQTDNVPAMSADLGTIQGVAIDPTGARVYLADATHNVVRCVDLASGKIVTVAGTGEAGYSGDNGRGVSAALHYPMGLAVDPSGNLFIADSGNDVIRRLDASGVITTWVGHAGQHQPNDGPRVSASLYAPRAVALDALGNLYIADTGNNLVRELDTTGQVSTIVGPGVTGYINSGSPSGVAVDAEGTVYFSNGLSRVFALRHGSISVVAGTSSIGFAGDGGPATEAQLTAPAGLALDASGSLYIADRGNLRLRQIDALGKIHTAAGTGAAPNYKPFLRQSADVFAYASLAAVNAVAVSPDGNSVYLATGSATEGYGTGSNGPGSITRLSYSDAIVIPEGEQATRFTVEVLADTSSLYVSFQASAAAQEFNASPLNCNDGNLIPKGSRCQFQVTFTPAASGRRFAQMFVLTDSAQAVYGIEGYAYLPQATLLPGHISQAPYSDRGSYNNGRYTPGGPHVFSVPTAEASDQHNFTFLADSGANRIYSIDFNGIVSIAAGTGAVGFGGDGGFGFNAQFNNPSGLALSDSGILYIADTGNHRVRAYDTSTGGVVTVAGDGQLTHTADGLPALNASLNTPTALALTPSGDLLIADPADNRVRRLDIATGLLGTVAGTGTAGYGGEDRIASASQLTAPSGVAVARNGDVYISDTGNNIVRRVDGTSGAMTTIAGSGGAGAYGSDMIAQPLVAELNHPQQLLFDPAGGLYIADTGNNLVRYLTHPDPGSSQPKRLLTVAGSLTSTTHNGGSAIGDFLAAPQGMIFDNSGNLIIAESGYHDFQIVYGTQANLTFPDTPVNQSSAPQTVLLVETGAEASFNSSGLQPSIAYGDNPTGANFFLKTPSLPLPNCSALTQPLFQGEGCAVGLDFEPESAGAKTGSFELTENGTTSLLSQSIDVAGNGTGVLDFTFAPDTLPDATIGEAYSQAVRVTGGSGYLKLAQSGTLPAGIQYSAPYGIAVFAGTPTEVGSFPMSLQVTDAANNTTTAGFTLVVRPKPIVITVTEGISASDVSNEDLSLPLTTGEAISTTDLVTVTPGKFAQTCTFPTAGTNATYGAQSTLQGHCSSGLAPIYGLVSGPATISGSLIRFTGASPVTVRLIQSGDAHWAAADSIVVTFLVDRATLLVVPTDTHRNYEQQNPALTYTINGLLPGDSISGSPVLSTTAVLNSPAGAYPITAQIGTLSAPNYAITLQQGTLTVTGGVPQSIIFLAFPLNIPLALQKLTLTAHSTSGLPVAYSVSGPATVSGNTLTLTGTGVVRVMASQPGNATFNSAPAVLRSFTVIP